MKLWRRRQCPKSAPWSANVVATARESILGASLATPFQHGNLQTTLGHSPTCRAPHHHFDRQRLEAELKCGGNQDFQALAQVWVLHQLNFGSRVRVRAQLSVRPTVRVRARIQLASESGSTWPNMTLRHDHRPPPHPTASPFTSLGIGWVLRRREGRDDFRTLADLRLST